MLGRGNTMIRRGHTQQAASGGGDDGPLLVADLMRAEHEQVAADCGSGMQLDTGRGAEPEGMAVAAGGRDREVELELELELTIALQVHARRGGILAALSCALDDGFARRLGSESDPPCNSNHLLADPYIASQ